MVVRLLGELDPLVAFGHRLSSVTHGILRTSCLGWVVWLASLIQRVELLTGQLRCYHPRAPTTWLGFGGSNQLVRI